MTALVMPFRRDPLRPPPGDPARTVGCQSADEALLAAQLLLACAPPSLDRLDACPAVQMRQGAAVQPIVIVDNRGLQVIASADVMRRIAVTLDASSRQGAALDLMQAADQAEELSRQIQKGAH